MVAIISLTEYFSAKEPRSKSPLPTTGRKELGVQRLVQNTGHISCNFTECCKILSDSPVASFLLIEAMKLTVSQYTHTHTHTHTHMHTAPYSSTNAGHSLCASRQRHHYSGRDRLWEDTGLFPPSVLAAPSVPASEAGGGTPCPHCCPYKGARQAGDCHVTATCHDC